MTRAPPTAAASYTSEEARSVVASLRAAGPALRSRTSVELVTALGRAGSRFGDPRDPLRIEAEAALPAEAGFSPQMSSRIIDGMAHG